MIRVLIALCFTLVLLAAGCSQTTGSGGSAGDAGVGGGGAGGDGGMGGSAGIGGGGVGGVPIDCIEPPADRCRSPLVEPHRTCCDHGVPDQPNACNGTESLENPASCTPTGSRVFYRVTLLEVEEDCDVGYDLDRCNGETCVRGGLAPGEGADGADNALAGLGAILVGIGGDLAWLNQGLSDGLCGRTDSVDAGTCEGGDNDGEPCIASSDCLWPEGQCNSRDDDCLAETERFDIYFVVDSNPAEGCANVDVLAGGEAYPRVLNLTNEGCLSGTLGTLMWLGGDYGNLTKTVVRTTLSPEGFSHGLLGAVLDVHAAIRVIEAITYSFPDAGRGFWADINTPAVPPATPPAQCDGLSATFRIGGIVADPREGSL